MKRVLALLLAAVSFVGCKKGDQSTASEAKDVLVPFTKSGADHAALSATLRPKPEDYEAVFVGDAAAQAKGAMESLWDAGKILDPAVEQTEIDISGATTDQLSKQEGTAKDCPAAYKDIADKINPKVTVYCFRFVKPGEKGGYVGSALVNVNGHWAYFPKPYQYLK